MHVVDRCPACGVGHGHTVARLDTERRHRFIAFSRVKYGGELDALADLVPPEIVACDDCGHHWYRRQPSDEQLGRMYAAGRPLFAAPGREPSAAMLHEMVRLRRLVAHTTPTLLDYGSGYGRWARAACAAGFSVTAFEPSAARGGEVGTPFELVHSLEAVRDRRFSVIQLEQVLEHLRDPLAALQAIKSHCEPLTVLRITVPNVLRAPEGSQLWALWPFDGRTAHTMAPYEHLQGFTPHSLEVLLKRAGFAPLPVSRLWRHYPELPVRAVGGRLVPTLGSTLRLVSAR
jgi:SAM-dependent methyltransferase